MLNRHIGIRQEHFVSPPPLKIMEFPGGLKSHNLEIPGGLRLRIVEFSQGMREKGGNSTGLTHNNMRFHWSKTNNSGNSNMEENKEITYIYNYSSFRNHRPLNTKTWTIIIENFKWQNFSSLKCFHIIYLFINLLFCFQ